MSALETFAAEFEAMKERLDRVEAQLAKTEPPDNGETWLTAQELHSVIGKSVSAIYRDARSGKIPSKLFGGSRRFPLSQFERI